MESLISPLKIFVKLFSRLSSNNNRNIRGGTVKGDSNVVTYDQSVNPTITLNPTSDTNIEQIRLDGLNAVWKAVLEIKQLPTTAMFHIDIAHPDVTDEDLVKNPYYRSAKAEIAQDNLMARAKVGQEAEKYEPFVSPRLWSLLRAYRILSVRPSMVLVNQGEKQARQWWNDQIISKLLAEEFMPTELQHFTPPSEMPLKYALERIEQEIKDEIRTATGGRLMVLE